MAWANMNTDIPSPTEARLDRGHKGEKATDTGSHFPHHPVLYLIILSRQKYIN